MTLKAACEKKSHRPPFCVPAMIGRKDFYMTENEKKLLQAKHRLEEAEMRNREKERKARTRRLIQLGAITESVFPETRSMELEDAKRFLEQKH